LSLEEPDLLTLPQIARVVGVEYRTLHSWVGRGLVEPSLQRSRGTGVPNLFSRADAVKVKVIAELRHAGLSFELLQRASAGLGAHPAALTHGAMVLVNGTVKVVDPQRALEAIEGETLTLVYNTKSAIEAVDASIARAKPI
jgi:DNA-binding transcriptional MerR regulator